MVLAALDVHYPGEQAATAACVLSRSFSDAAPAREVVARVASVEPYEPGAFSRRELPALLAVLARVEEPLEAIIIDANVWLADGAPGLGARLHERVKVPVIGVAKTPFRGSPAIPVLRGRSAKPLHVTAVGVDAAEAAERIRSMHGEHRIPTLLRAVDRLARAGQTTSDHRTKRTSR